MKLKDSTFAIIAEKENSISHKWIYGNPDIYWYWNKGCYYEYDKGKVRYFNPRANEYPDKDIPIYTESEFEALLKAEQDNEATQTFGGKDSIGKTAQTFPAKGGGNITLEGFSPLSNIKGPVKATESNQVVFSYHTAIDLLAYYTKIDKGLIKIEMP